MNIKNTALLSIVMLSFTFCHASEIKRYPLRKLLTKAGYSYEHKNRIINLYESSKTQNLAPGMVYNSIAEGVAKHIAPEKLQAITANEIEKIKWTKSFCERNASANNACISNDSRTTHSIIISLRNGISKDDIQKLHSLHAVYKKSPSEFNSHLTALSNLKKRNIPADMSIEMLNQAYSKGYSSDDSKKLLNVFSKVNGARRPEAKNLIVQYLGSRCSIDDITRTLSQKNLINRNYMKHNNNGPGKKFVFPTYNEVLVN